MTESTLSADFEEIQTEVADFLGYGRDSSKWSDEITERLGAIIKAGLRQFYFPPKIQSDKDPHKWSFLTPVSSLSTVTTYKTGTVEVSGGLCTLTGGSWPTWAASNGILTIGGVIYSITTRADASYLYVVGDDVAAGAEYTLDHNGDYDLPDDFGSMTSRYMTFNSDIIGPRVKFIGEGQIRTFRQGNTDTGQPLYAAVRPKVSGGTTGQRWELMLYPIPDDIYTMYYRYRLLPNSISAPLFPYGGSAHSQTIIQSCIAAAELKMDGIRGVQWEHFVSLLTASIEQDLEVSRVMDFGYNGDNESQPNRGRSSSNYTVTLNGVEPEDF